MSPKYEIDGIHYYENELHGIELQPVPSCYHFDEDDEAYRVVEDLTWQQQHGLSVGWDEFLPGHEVILWDGATTLGSMHESHLHKE